MHLIFRSPPIRIYHWKNKSKNLKGVEWSNERNLISIVWHWKNQKRKETNNWGGGPHRWHNTINVLLALIHLLLVVCQLLPFVSYCTELILYFCFQSIFLIIFFNENKICHYLCGDPVIYGKQWNNRCHIVNVLHSCTVYIVYDKALSHIVINDLNWSVRIRKDDKKLHTV